MIGDPTELLIYLEEEAAKQRLRLKDGGWGWRKGCEVFIAPESRCSFCNATFETNRVYVLDSLNHQVPRQWRLETGEPVRQGNKVYHPHAFHPYGGVCMNEADGLAQLIFNSINTGPSYHAWDYYYDVGHICLKFPQSRCPQCKKSIPSFAMIHYYGTKYLCSKLCIEDARKTSCASCFGERKGGDDNPDGAGPYCKKCLPHIENRMDVIAELIEETEEDPDDE